MFGLGLIQLVGLIRVLGGDGWTLKLNIIPLWLCSAMWQCAIHRPGFVTSSRMSTVCAGTHEHGVFPDQIGLRLAVPRENEETARAVDVEWVVHRMVRFHFVDQSDLYPVADTEGPVDRPVLGTGLPSTSFQIMLLGSEARLISGIRSSHSRPSPGSCSAMC